MALRLDAGLRSGARIGHEFLGVVEDVGSDVSGLRVGDLVVAPFVWADNTCDFCAEGLQTSCRHGGMWARDGVDGGQAEAVRVPQAQGTLVKLPVGEDSERVRELTGGDGTHRVLEGSDVLMDGGVTASYFYGELADDGGRMGATQS